MMKQLCEDFELCLIMRGALIPSSWGISALVFHLMDALHDGSTKMMNVVELLTMKKN